MTPPAVKMVMMFYTIVLLSVTASNALFCKESKIKSKKVQKRDSVSDMKDENRKLDLKSGVRLSVWQQRQSLTKDGDVLVLFHLSFASGVLFCHETKATPKRMK